MSPTIVSRDGKPVLVIGAPGGSRIITVVVHLILNTVDYGMNLQEAIDAPRFHQQWLPEGTFVEAFALSPDTRRILADMGHKFTDELALEPRHRDHRRRAVARRRARAAATGSTAPTIRAATRGWRWATDTGADADRCSVAAVLAFARSQSASARSTAAARSSERPRSRQREPVVLGQRGHRRRDLLPDLLLERRGARRADRLAQRVGGADQLERRSARRRSSAARMPMSSSRNASAHRSS